MAEDYRVQIKEGDLVVNGPQPATAESHREALEMALGYWGRAHEYFIEETPQTPGERWMTYLQIGGSQRAFVVQTTDPDTSELIDRQERAA